MIWMYIRKILGSGLHWEKSQEQFRAAVAFALALGTVTERILMFMWREEITWGGVVYMSGKT